MFTVTDRPRIGVMVNTNAGAANDKIGATIGSVTPDGPAAKAGLEAGDIITKFNGTALGGANPGQKLVELAQALSPGDTVKVEYRRGTANRSATIVAADLGGAAWAWTSGRPDAGQMIQLRRGMADRERAFVELERGMAGMGNAVHLPLQRRWLRPRPGRNERRASASTSGRRRGSWSWRIPRTPPCRSRRAT